VLKLLSGYRISVRISHQGQIMGKIGPHRCRSQPLGATAIHKEPY